jgi:glycosyltransferase involved in cell wall biosynthesis
VIVVDDGSTDDTASVMAQYGGRLRYIRQANQGVAAARNVGCRVAAGEYLSFLDDDDLYLPHKIERQVRLLNDRPALGLVHFGDPVQFIDDVLDHLPDRALGLRRYWPEILCNLYTRMAMQSYGRGDIALAKSQFRQIFDPACAAPMQPEVFVKSLTYAAIHLPVPNPAQFIDVVLDNLPAEAAGLRCIRVRTLNKVHIKLSREASMTGRRGQAVHHYLSALRYRPISISDRRTATLLLKVLASG